MIARARGCGPCGVSILILSVIATAASTQPNRMILRTVFTLALRAPSGDWLQGGYLANRWGTVTEVTGQYCEIELASILPR